MTELRLPLEPRTHTDDPASSFAAEERARAKFMASHMGAVLLAVTLSPGQTAGQLAVLIAWDDQFSHERHERLCQVRRRLSDLRLRGEVYRITSKGDAEARWYVTQA